MPAVMPWIVPVSELHAEHLLDESGRCASHPVLGRVPPSPVPTPAHRPGSMR